MSLRQAARSRRRIRCRLPFWPHRRELEARRIVGVDSEDLVLPRTPAKAPQFPAKSARPCVEKRDTMINWTRLPTRRGSTFLTAHACPTFAHAKPTLSGRQQRPLLGRSLTRVPRARARWPAGAAVSEGRNLTWSCPASHGDGMELTRGAAAGRGCSVFRCCVCPAEWVMSHAHERLNSLHHFQWYP